MRQVFFIVLIFLLPLACAVPVPPTGGPRDQTPPSVTESTPASGETNFSGRNIEFLFSEPIDIRSFGRAFSITPDIAGIPEISGSGRKIKVRLPEDPRAETTYILNLDVSLRDVHNVALPAPITIAFSTGDEINAGRMSGHVVRSLDGDVAANIDVFAFADNDSLSIASIPLYRTQTGRDGSFSFDYLSERPYFVVAVQDANRNRMIDPGESYAVPPVLFLEADSSGTAPETPWVLASRDRVAPELERVRAVSTRDLELRFSEKLDLLLNHPGFFGSGPGDRPVLRDSVGSETTFFQFFFKESNPRTIFARIDSIYPGRFTLLGSPLVRDSSNNYIRRALNEFEVLQGLPLAQDPQFLMWTPDSAFVSTTSPRTIWYGEDFGFRTTVPTDTVVNAVIRDTTGAVFPAIFERADPSLFLLKKEGGFGFDQPFHIDINQSGFGGPDSLITGFFEYSSGRRTGALSFSIQVSPNPEKNILVVEVFDASDLSKAFARYSHVTQEGIKPVVLDHLPGGKEIRLRVFQSSSPTHWRSGEIIPWIPPDPIAWIDVDQRVRARWESVLPDTVDFRTWPRRLSSNDSTKTH